MLPACIMFKECVAEITDMRQTVISVFIVVAEDEEPSLGAFENHSGPVHGLQVHEGLLYTCSGDNTARAYSLVVRCSVYRINTLVCPC